MWSNNQTAAETVDKNMTSLKSKITHRKRKNSKSKSGTAVSQSGEGSGGGGGVTTTTMPTINNHHHHNQINNNNRKSPQNGDNPTTRKTSAARKNNCGAGNNSQKNSKRNAKTAPPDLIENLERIDKIEEDDDGGGGTGGGEDNQIIRIASDVIQLTTGALRNPPPATVDSRRESSSSPPPLQQQNSDATEIADDDQFLINNVNVKQQRYSDSFVVVSAASDRNIRNSNDKEEDKANDNNISGELYIAEEKEEQQQEEEEERRSIISGGANSNHKIIIDKAERKTRRFSDIFRYGALKPSTSCENIKNIKSSSAKMMKQQPTDFYQDDEFPGVQLRKKPSNESPKKASEIAAADKKHKKALSRSESKSSKHATNNKQSSNGSKKDDPGGVTPTTNNDSYLKRVKSKIYKNKNDSNAAEKNTTMPNIAENTKTGKKHKKKKNNGGPQEEKKLPDLDVLMPELRKSVSQFDFRLIRQTSNLERIRPRTFGLRTTSSSNLAIPELIAGGGGGAAVPNCDEKPILAKSKSSSAINLNLLRARRNKLLEQAKKNCKIVQNEFDFIGFGASVRGGGAAAKTPVISEVDGGCGGVVLLGGGNSNSNSVKVTRKFSNQTSIINNNNNNSNNAGIGGGPDENAGETKSGHPVSRTGSDRRPDAVREESSSRTQESQDNVDQETDSAHQDSTVSLPSHTGNKKRTSTNINRSESVKEQSEKRKQRRNISDPLHNTTNETVDLDHQSISYQTNSGSSSNSSLSSNRSIESPSTSLDAVSGLPGTQPGGSGWDSDMDVEADPPDWQSSVPDEELANLHPHEKIRQDVINELFHTERSHVRNLRVLDHVFRKRLQLSKLLKSEEINLIFPNLSELLDIHSHLNTAMKVKRKESPVVMDIGDMLLEMFDGARGEQLQTLAASFCKRQQLALEFIKERRKKDSRFDNFLSECEKNSLCRRLPLQGILPTEMQRLSKYPLLLERLIDSDEKNKQRDPEVTQPELNKLKQAHDRSKEILNYVNEAAKIAFNEARLEEIQKHLDTSMFEKTEHPIVNEFKNLDLTRYNLIHEGTMHLRRPNKQPVSLHIVLLEEAVILLQKDAERYILKFFQAFTSSQQPLAPIIKTSTLLVRANAASKSSLFLVNTSTQNSQMYDLLARDSTERDIWFKHISDAAEAYNRREGKSKRSEPTPDTDEAETLQDLPSTKDVSERAEPIGGDALSGGEMDSSGPSGENSDIIAMDMEDQREKQSDVGGECANNSNEAVAAAAGGGGVLLKVTADDWPLVQPIEVHVAMPPVHTAEPVLTPIEQIRRKDEEVRKALTDREGLVADLLSIPRDDYHLIADIITDETLNKGVSDREPTELAFAALFQVHQIQSMMNDSLHISETDAVHARGGKHASCTSNETLISKQNNHVPSVPVHPLQKTTATLSTLLTTLMSVLKHRDEERDRLRKELQRMREQLHENLALHGPQDFDNPDLCNADSTNVVGCTAVTTQSGDLESIEESPTENENN